MVFIVHNKMQLYSADVWIHMDLLIMENFAPSIIPREQTI